MWDKLFFCGPSKREYRHLINLKLIPLEDCNISYFSPTGDAVSSFFFESYIEVAERFVGKQSMYLLAYLNLS